MVSVVVVGDDVGGNVFFEHLNDLVDQSHRNILGGPSSFFAPILFFRAGFAFYLRRSCQVLERWELLLLFGCVGDLFGVVQLDCSSSGGPQQK